MSDISSTTIGMKQPGNSSQATPNGERSEKEFAWLDLIEPSDCYMSLDESHDRPTKSLDFGQDGVTGSLTAWHEMLQMTAPDDECGLVFVRGAFPDHAGALLARAQRRNDTGTFGLELRIDKNSGFVLERTPSQGLINNRWPYSRFNFVDSDSSERDSSERNFASSSMCSFVRDNVLYQINRITPSTKLSSAPNSPTNSAVNLVNGREVEIQIGGAVRFGCPNTVLAAVPGGNPMTSHSNDNMEDQAAHLCGPAPPFKDTYRVKCPPTKVTPYVMACESSRHQQRLEMRLWINGKPEILVPPRDSSIDNDEVAHGESETITFQYKRRLSIPVSNATCIIASFSLVPSSDGSDINWDKTEAIQSVDIGKYLGYAENSLAATYRLWSRLIGAKPAIEDDNAFVTKTIGRCVEEIMGVLSVPVNSNYSIDGESQCIAQIKTIIDCQVVDLETTLWHVRLLVKAYRALGSMSEELLNHQDPYPEIYYEKERFVPYRAIRDDYRSRIAQRLQRIVKWVLNVLPILKNNSQHYHRNPILMTDINSSSLRNSCPQYTDSNGQSIRGCRTEFQKAISDTDKARLQGRKLRDQKWFCALIVCYVMQQDSSMLLSENMTKELKEALSTFNKIPNWGDTLQLIGSEDPYTCILRSYHSYSIAQIARALQLNPNDTKRHLDCSRSWQGKAERAIRHFIQGRFTHYCVGHEVANMALISKEITTKGDNWQNKSLLELIKNMIKTRRETEKVSSGLPLVKRFDAKDVRSGMPYLAPWELSCLEHHLPLNLDLPVSKKDDIRIMEDCREFLLVDYTFVPTWDPGKASTEGLWWDLSTSSIICTKLLTEKCPGISDYPYQRYESSDVQGDSKSDHRDVVVSPEFLKGQKTIIELLKQSNGVDPDIVPGVNWREMRPQVLYHPDTFVHSLQDTPGVFGKNQKRNMEVWPKIKKSLKYLDISKWTLPNLHDKIPPGELRHISLFDLSLLTSDNDAPKIGISCIKGRADESWKKNCSVEGQNEIGIIDALDEEIKCDEATKHQKLRRSDAWDLYFLDQRRQYYAWYGFKSHESLRHRDEVLREYQKPLLTVLSDSLVDLGTKYRILFAHRLSSATLPAFIYMWHPDAVDTFENQLSRLSHFYDGKARILLGADLWTTSITLSYWYLVSSIKAFLSKLEEEAYTKNSQSPRGIHAFRQRFLRLFRSNSGDSTPDYHEHVGDKVTTRINQFPPVNVHDERSQPEPSKIQDKSASLVITGDPLGRYWTCTIICDLIDEKAISNHVKRANDILQRFINQQYTGRVLMFIYLLGILCESLAEECDKFTRALDDIINIHPMTLLVDGLEWHQSEAALESLKEMLWGYEALSVYNDKLRESVKNVKKARVKMTRTLDVGREIRPPDLKRKAEVIFTEFDRRFSRLSNVYDSICQRIDQGTRLREGMASVRAIDQNQNIGMLTWVNITYLPLAFLATLFSIKNAHITFEFASLGLFIGVIVALIITTIILAENLRRILDLISKVWAVVKTRTKVRTKTRASKTNFGKLAKKPSSLPKPGKATSQALRRRWFPWSSNDSPDIEGGHRVANSD